MFRKVLVPIDFSPHSERALDHARVLAKEEGAQVHLLHVCHLPTQIAMPEMAMLPANVWEDLRNQARKRLTEYSEQLKQAGIDVHAHVSEGVPSQAILAAVERLEADLVVMGTRGRSGIKHVVLGSVAERTLRMAPVPVLTVHADGEAREFSPGKILVPLDFSPASDRALELASGLVKAHGSGHLILVHGYYIPVELEQFLVARGQGAPLMEQITGGVTEQLTKTLTSLQDRGISSEYVADRANPETLIVDLARNKSVDLIVMGTHGRRGLSHLLLGSVAERVVRTAPCPVLTAKPREEAA